MWNFEVAHQSYMYLCLGVDHPVLKWVGNFQHYSESYSIWDPDASDGMEWKPKIMEGGSTKFSIPPLHDLKWNSVFFVVHRPLVPLITQPNLHASILFCLPSEILNGKKTLVCRLCLCVVTSPPSRNGPTTVPDNNRNSGLPPTTVHEMSHGLGYK